MHTRSTARPSSRRSTSRIAGTVSVAKARARFADTIDLVRTTGQRIVLSKSGKRAAAIVPIEDLDLLERLQDAADIKAARAALKAPGSPWDEVKQRLGL
ncbi:MAG: type II toxin-antitoxin system Phd/YefM family antitoxin [Phycisphaerales bacterium]|nr:type II toxin-antitoxin system Phd/YefM family antitoxin [Phycisphaerales bacterium]